MLLYRSIAEDPVKNLAESRNEVAAFIKAPIPNSENAAIDYRAACAAMIPYVPPPADLTAEYPFSNVDSGNSYFDRPDIAAYLASNAKAYALTSRAAAKVKCDWQIDFLNNSSNYPNLLQLRELVGILCTNARRKAHQGDHRGAADDVARVRKLAQHLWHKPMPSSLIGSFACAIHEQADVTVQAIQIYDQPKTGEEVGYYVESMGENWDPFEQIDTNICGYSSLMKYQGDLIAALKIQYPSAKARRVSETTLSFLLNYSASRREYVKIVEREATDVRSRKIPPNLETLKRELGCRIHSPPSEFSSLNVNAISTVYLIMADERSCVRTGLAVMQYQRKYSRNPHSLAELVPEFLHELPTSAHKPGPLIMNVENQDVEWTHYNVEKSLLKPGTIVIGNQDAANASTITDYNPIYFYVQPLE